MTSPFALAALALAPYAAGAAGSLPPLPVAADYVAYGDAAPWSPWAYEKLAAAYQELGWRRLASHWKERGRFARKVSAGHGAHKALLKRLLGE